MLQPGQSSVAQCTKRAQLNDNSTSAGTKCAKRTKLNDTNITGSPATVPASRIRHGGEHDINTDTATNAELLLLISKPTDTDTAVTSGSSTEVYDDTPSPLQVGTAVRMKIPGYGWFEGSVASLEENHAVCEWDDSSSSRHTKKAILSCIAREQKKNRKPSPGFKLR